MLTLSAFSGVEQVNAGSTDLKMVGFNNAYDEIVRGLIRNWESPIEYLQDRGYLSGEYRDTSIIKPYLDAIMVRIERKKRQKKMEKRDSPIFGHEEMGPLPGEIFALDQLDIMLDKIKHKGTTERKSRVVDSKQSARYPNVAQLMATMQTVRRRDEQKHLPGSRSKHDQPAALRSPSRQPDHTFNAMLQQMMENASAQTLESEKASAVHTFEAKHNAEDETELRSVPNSSSTYRGEQSIPNIPIDTLDTNLAPSSQASKNVEAPSYLNWDIGKHHLVQYSPVAKESYVNKLVRLFVEKEKLRENQRRMYTLPP